MRVPATIFLGIFATVGVLCPAVAQVDGPFDGLYAGGQVGWESIDLSADQTPITSSEDDGITYSIVGGYRRQFDTGWVGGLDVSLGRSTADGTIIATLGEGPAAFAVDSDWQYGMDAHIGYMLTSETLVFGRVGYHWLELNVTPQGPTGAAFADAASHTLDDIRFGGGIEVAFTDQINIRITGNYVDYGSETVELESYGFKAGAVYHY